MREKNSELISIGELSRLTGVGIKSLRYYGDIGVLVPAHIDADSRYRYYTFDQISLVVSIQFYVKLGIPLEKLREFTDADGTTDFEKQIQYGIDAARQNIRDLQDKVRQAEYLSKEISRSRQLLSGGGSAEYYFDAMDLWTEPVRKPVSEKEYGSIIKGLMLEANKAGAEANCISGILMLEGRGCYCFISLPRITKTLKNSVRFMHLPAGRFVSVACDYIFPDSSVSLLENASCAVMTELFTGKFNHKDRKYELRWRNRL